MLRASAIPMRSLKPLSLSAKPMAEPLNTSQNALEANPEKISAAGTDVSVAASRKNSNETSSPATAPVAHSTMQAKTIATIRASSALIVPRQASSEIMASPVASNAGVILELVFNGLASSDD